MVLRRLRMVAAAVAVGGVVSLAGAGSASAFTVDTGTGVASGTSIPVAANMTGTRTIIPSGSGRIDCTNGSLSGAVTAGSYAAGATIGQVRLKFNDFSLGQLCSGPLQLQTLDDIKCDPANVVIDSVSGGVATGRLDNVRCEHTVYSGPCKAVIEGDLPVSYSAAGGLTVYTGGQTLTVVSTLCPGLGLPLGASAIFGMRVSVSGVANLSLPLLGSVADKPVIS